MALLNMLESQRNEIFAMLEGTSPTSTSLGAPRIGGGSGFGSTQDTSNPDWKVLIYDAKGQRILSTLVKVGVLRLKGITLHLNLHNEERAGVPEVPAVYFCEATEQSIERIEKDLSSLASSNTSAPLPLYRGYRLNFINKISTPQLQRLASTAVQAGTAQLVESVIDRYLGFVSLSPTEFELGVKGTFQALNGKDDEIIQDQVHQIVQGLLSVCITLKVMPVIRCSSSMTQPSRMIATLLAKELKDAYDTGVFKGSTPKGHAAVSSRPCLMLLDRSVDLSIPVEHAWTYRGLIKDLLHMDANRVTFEMTNPNGSTTKCAHDLDNTDSYWESWMELPFPDLLKSVNAAVENYDQEMKAFASKEAMEVSALSAALSSLPVMTEKKRLLDLHTNLNTALLEKVNERSIDQFCALEEGLLMGTIPVQTGINQLKDLYEKNTGDSYDRRRTILSLCGSRLTSSDKQRILTDLKPYLVKDHPDMIAVYEYVMALTESAAKLFNRGSTASPQSRAFKGVMAEAEKAVLAQTDELWQGKLGQFGKGLLDHGKGFVMQGMKAVVGIQRSTPASDLVRELMSDRCDSSILTLDPLQCSRDGDFIPLTNLPGSFLQGIVFMVGEGSFLESHNIRQHLHKSHTGGSTGQMTAMASAGSTGTSGTAAPERMSLSVGGNVVYGCTTFENANEFAEILKRTAGH